jgi:hypothetical protein
MEKYAETSYRVSVSSSAPLRIVAIEIIRNMESSEIPPMLDMEWLMSKVRFLRMQSIGGDIKGVGMRIGEYKFFISTTWRVNE